MKRLLIGLVVLLSLPCFAQRSMWWAAAQKPATGTAPTYLLSENFEAATGYENADWNASGTIYSIYSTSPAPLQGTNSLLVYGDSYIYRTITAQSEIWVYYQFSQTNTTGTESAMILLYGTDATQAAVYINGSSIGRVRAVCLPGGPEQLSTGAMTSGVKYHVWLHYVKGTGANAVMSVGFSTDGTRPTSGSNYTEVTNGTGTQDIARIYVRCEVGGEAFVFDRLLLSTATIGDNP